ncbi:MAG: ABC-type transport auxiliary lipoprotein family protein [Parvularcula sp.]
MTRNVLTPLFVSLILSGCVSLLPDSGDLPPRIALDAGPATNRAGATLPVSLVIGDPTADALLNASSVAITKTPLEFQYLDDADWTDRVPVLVRRYLVKRLRNTGDYQAVGDKTDITRGDFVLQPDIEAFHLDAAGKAEMATVAINALLSDRQGQIIGAKRFAATIPTASRSRHDRAEALNQAAAKVGSDIEDWAREAIAAYSSGKS